MTLLDLANAALNACGSDDVLIGLSDDGTVITDDNKSARLCNQNYNIARRAVLAKHPWKFAIDRVVLTAVSTELQPAFGGSTAFLTPQDYIRAISIDDSYSGFIREGALLLVESSGPINLRYIYDIKEIDSFDPLFFDALVLDLALRIVYPLTQSNERTRDIQEAYRSVITKARFADSLEQSMHTVSADTYTNARLTFRQLDMQRDAVVIPEGP